MKLSLLAFAFMLNFTGLIAKDDYSISGIIRDSKTGIPIESVSVSLFGSHIGSFTDVGGKYFLPNIPKGNSRLIVSSFGYMSDTTDIMLMSDLVVNNNLKTSSILLGEVTIQESYKKGAYNQLYAEGSSIVSKQASTNFSKLLSSLPGMSTVDIGSNVSKPILRGLGFNRIAVVNRGINVQDQQWGADHGLEINAHDMERAIVYKGASSLQFGSDAIAGAIEILPSRPKEKNTFAGEVNSWVGSNNGLYGSAILTEYRKTEWYFKAMASYEEYGDYKVPTDEFEYLSYKLKIEGQRLKNTAGKGNNISTTLGYWGESFKMAVNISNIYSKHGFFAGAHGFPDPSKLIDDGSNRNIEMPYTRTNHFTLTNNIDWSMPIGRLLINAGYQENRREENSYFHTHYSHASAPKVDPNLELDFNLKTYSINTRLHIDEEEAWKKTIGLSSEYQQNEVAGYSFFLPSFKQITGGVFFANTYLLNKEITFNGGLRYDIVKTNISGSYDHILAEELRNNNASDKEIEAYANRAYAVRRRLGSFSGAWGIVYKPSRNKEWYATLGKSFRFPTAVELAANGIHHAAFRHEQGNPNLNAEQGYSIDMGFKYDKDRIWKIELSPFVNYFNNFIYLQPSKQFSMLPHGGQIYAYQQNKVVATGGELFLRYAISKRLSLTSIAEYVFNQNLDTHYALPFTPPFTLRSELAYEHSQAHRKISLYRFAVSHGLYAAQNRISQAEDKTPGTQLFNISASAEYKIYNKCKIQASIQIDNIFDTLYLNHLNFYRKLNIPEPGRNIRAFIRIPFKSPL
ncbi:TonB-dependent receptor [Bacteroidales bacterium]|nr:TonB-dependent receptor [Bacteroidales bacterium]